MEQLSRFDTVNVCLVYMEMSNGVKRASERHT